jgi:hypothetical protein
MSANEIAPLTRLAKVRVPTQRERALALLRVGPQSTLDLHANYILAVSNVIFRLRLEGHVIVNTPLPNGVALYSLIGDRGAK